MLNDGKYFLKVTIHGILKVLDRHTGSYSEGGKISLMSFATVCIFAELPSNLACTA